MGRSGSSALLVKTKEGFYLDNALAQARLAADLEIVSTAIFSGHGKGKTDDWSPEPGLLALGISEAEATQLAKTYRQNAYVRVSRGQPARLVICV